jgi:hypothetical protein
MWRERGLKRKRNQRETTARAGTAPRLTRSDALPAEAFFCFCFCARIPTFDALPKAQGYLNIRFCSPHRTWAETGF